MVRKRAGRGRAYPDPAGHAGFKRCQAAGGTAAADAAGRGEEGRRTGCLDGCGNGGKEKGCAHEAPARRVRRDTRTWSPGRLGLRIGMSRSQVIKVEPGVLKWLRETSGCNVGETSEKLGVAAGIMGDLESGAKDPTLAQLERMSSLYGCSLASFLLPEPKQVPLPRDCRALPGKKGTFDKRTILAINRSRGLQDLGLELSLNIKSETRPRIGRGAVLTDDVHAAAVRFRRSFDLTPEKQVKFKGAGELFDHLRGALENANILVFQLPMPVGDAGGFALADRQPAVITINSEDEIGARLFTLMHEFGHVLLGETAIDMPGAAKRTGNRSEEWCDAFAASFLLPAYTDWGPVADQGSTDTETLDRLSKRYKVGRAVILRRMLDLDRISRAEFEGVLAGPAFADGVGAGSGRGGTAVPQDRMCRSRMGGRFVSLVADNFDGGHITYADALGYLSVKSGYFEKAVSGEGR